MEPETLRILTTALSVDRNLSPAAVREHLADAGGQLIDVREPWEYEHVHLPDAKLIPLAELPSRLREINPDQPAIIYCHHGIRSWHAVCFLVENGFEQVFNLSGGIDAWSRDIDPALPRY